MFNLKMKKMKKMKKLALIVLGLVFFTIISCTNEDKDEQSQIENSKNFRLVSGDLERAKELFLNMIRTEDYKRFMDVTNDFVSKMNYNIVNVRSKEEYMNWISSNLNLTKFASVEDFERSLDDMITKQSVLMSNNTEIYSYLDNAEPDQILEIIEPSLGLPPTLYEVNSCSDGCINTCFNSLDVLDSVTALQYAASSNHPFMWSIINAQYWAAFKVIVDNLNSCISNC